MKITTGGTGMVSSQSSMTASVLQQAIAALNYNYTWAIDFSHPDVDTGIFYSTDMTVFTNGGTYEKVSTGLRVALDHNPDTIPTLPGSPKITFREADLTSYSSTHSNGSSGNDIPAGASADTGPTPGYVPDNTDFDESHPGRYLSLVLTIDKFDIYEFPSSHPGPDPPGESEIGFRHWADDGGTNYFLYNHLNDSSWVNTGVKYVDGVEGSIRTQADYNAILGQVKVLTYDYKHVFNLSDPIDDPDRLEIYPTYLAKTDFDFTLHGIIFSDTPPNAITLPVEITNPTIGSGPA